MAPARRRTVRALTAALAASALLAGCGGAEEAPASIVRTSACAVSAPSGFADAGVGAAVLEQVRGAVRQGLVDTTSTQRVSTPAQTQAALERFTSDGCTLTLLVGSGGAGALSQVAQEAPDRAFLAVGAGIGDDRPDNVLTVDFDLRDSAFLAGYAAAHATRTGAVAVSASTGQAGGEDLLAAFDEGAAAAQEADDDLEVRVVQAGMTEARTVEDTAAAGQEWARAATEEGADVLVPFGSASPQGVVEHLAALAQELEERDDAEDADEGDDAPDTEAREDLPYLIWTGSDGSKTLAGPVRKQVIASIVPQVGLGMRAVLTGWPGDDGDPLALLEVDGEPADASQEAMPEVVGGLEVRSREAVGDLDNGGVELVVSDGVLSQLTGLGRAVADGRELLDGQPAEGD
ncbi:MAG TPA: BMP family ABC transporter substrate-binding protein [Candidatus Brevibacterium intestinigallinarum]|nr:BMP family ABC transporter substrate-binding protein [Candidatus Brevibacterium intestinigallinarum]